MPRLCVGYSWQLVVARALSECNSSTLIWLLGASVMGPLRGRFSISSNHFVGTGEDRGRDHQTERPRGVEVDCQIEFAGRLDGHNGRFRALEDLVDETGRAAEQIAIIGANDINPPSAGKILKE